MRSLNNNRLSVLLIISLGVAGAFELRESHAACTAAQLSALAERESRAVDELTHVISHGDTLLDGRRVTYRSDSPSTIPQSDVDEAFLVAVVDDPSSILINPHVPNEMWVRSPWGDRFYRVERRASTVAGETGEAEEVTYAVTRVADRVPDEVRAAYPERFTDVAPAGRGVRGELAPVAPDRYTSSDLLELLSVRRRESRLPTGTFDLTVSRPPPGARDSSIRVHFLDPVAFSRHDHAEAALRALGGGIARARSQAGLKHIEGNIYELKLLGREGDTRFLVCLRNGVYEIGRAFDHHSSARIFSSRPCD
jgi:hypothetical protein